MCAASLLFPDFDEYHHEDIVVNTGNLTNVDVSTKILEKAFHTRNCSR